MRAPRLMRTLPAASAAGTLWRKNGSLQRVSGGGGGNGYGGRWRREFMHDLRLLLPGRVFSRLRLSSSSPAQWCSTVGGLPCKRNGRISYGWRLNPPGVRIQPLLPCGLRRRNAGNPPARLTGKTVHPYRNRNRAIGPWRARTPLPCKSSSRQNRPGSLLLQPRTSPEWNRGRPVGRASGGREDTCSPADGEIPSWRM
jgi:hypothetical protein